MRRLQSFGRFAGVMAIGIAAYVFAKFQGGFVSWFIFYTLIPFVAYSILLYFYPLNDITVSRHIERRHVTRNGQVDVVVTLKRRLPFPLLYVVLKDQYVHAEHEKTKRNITLLGFRKTYEYAYTLKDVQRGEYVLKAIEIEVVDFFNWIGKKKVFAVRDAFLVYPGVTTVAHDYASKGENEGQRLSAYRLAKDATMPSGVREYAPGDRMSWIHWKSFARTTKLMTKEFDEQRAEQYTVLLDCAASAAFEEAVEFTASVVATARQDQARLTLVTAGLEPDIIPSIQSADQIRQALVHLAKVRPQDPGKIRLPIRNVLSGGALLLVTAGLRLEFIRNVLANAPDGSTIVCFVALSDETDRDLLASIVAKVQLLGVTVKVLDPPKRSSATKRAVTS